MVCLPCVASNTSLWYVPLVPSLCALVTSLTALVARGFASRFEPCAGSVRKESDTVNSYLECLQVSLDVLEISN